ncbi:hypothetical protein TWF173_006674 [Orbilia oligospora]|nr:hypothetical protein TWF173_006674 [Orbilia oligospora]
MEASKPQTPSSFRFLDLPPEIRNEIYAYVLTNISIPSCGNRFRGPGMQHWRYPEQDADTPRPISLNPSFANRPRTDEDSTNPRLFELLNRCMIYVGDISGIPQTKLALLRVNRQIHDEAARVFYGGNVFKIEVSVAVRMRMRPVGSMHLTYPSVYDMSYTAPWERFGYQLVVDPEESTRQQLTENATVEIKIDLASYLLVLHLSRPDQVFDDMLGLKTSIEDSLEAGYIFSLGPWKSTFNDIPQILEKTWQEVLGKCKKRPEFRDDILQNTMQELDVGLREGSFWGKREGVLAVFLPMPGAPSAPLIPPTLVLSSDQ